MFESAGTDKGAGALFSVTCQCQNDHVNISIRRSVSHAHGAMMCLWVDVAENLAECLATLTPNFEKGCQKMA